MVHDKTHHTLRVQARGGALNTDLVLNRGERPPTWQQVRPCWSCVGSAESATGVGLVASLRLPETVGDVIS